MSVKHPAFLVIFLLTSLPSLANADDVPGKLRLESPKLDAFGDPLPPGVFARFGTTRLRLRITAKAVAFLDDTTIVSVGTSIQFWDAATGQMIREYQDKRLASADNVTITADCKRAIVRCTDQVYRVWDIATGKLLREIKFRHEDERAAKILDGFITAAADGSRWIAAEAFPVSDGVTQVRMSVYSLQGETGLADLPGELFGASGFAISPDGNCAVTASYGSEGETVLTYWDPGSGKRIRDDKPGVGQLLGIQFTPDRKAVLVAGESGIALRTFDGKDLWRASARMAEVKIVCINSKLIVARVRYRQQLEWETRVLVAETGHPLARWMTWDEGTAGAISPDNRRLVYAVERRNHVTSLIDGKELVAAEGHTGGVCEMSVTPDGRFLASRDGVDHRVLLWDLGTGKIVRKFQGTGPVRSSLAVSPDAELLACFAGNELCVWNVTNENAIRKLRAADDDEFKLICFLADSRRLAVRNGTTFWTIYDCQTKEKLKDCLLQADARFDEIVRQYDGRLLTVCRHLGPKLDSVPRYRGLDIWDILAGRVVRHLDGHKGFTPEICFSRDGRMLGVSYGHDVDIWDLATGQLRATLKNVSDDPLVYLLNDPSEPEATSVSFTISPDGFTVGVIRYEKPGVDLWDLRTGERYASLRGHEMPIYCLEFTPDGRRLLTGSADTTILGWDLTQPESRPRTLVSTLTDADLATHWDRLRNAKADEAFRSKWALVGDPRKTVEFLRKQLPSQPTISPEKLKPWISDLDSKDYSERERAQHALESHFDQAEELLRQALAKSISAESRSRITRIIDANVAAIPQPDQLRDLRAIEVLEQIGTPEARGLLRRLAKCYVPTAVSRDAGASLKRLESHGP